MANQPPTQDLVSSVDFTQFNEWSGSLMNSSLSSLAGNTAIDDGSGIGMTLWSFDIALDTPNVPIPTGATLKWQHYFWVRIPFAGANEIPKIYVWNANFIGPAEPPFYNWTDTSFDDSSILLQISTLQTQVTSALNAANTANSNSTNALNIANSANTTAINAANSVASAAAQAATALATANSASGLAQQASSTATAALATANSAAAAAALNKNITQINPGTVGQRIRVNNQGTSLEYYNTNNNIVILCEQILSNQGPTNGFPTRALNTKLSDLGSLCTALAANIFTLAQGVYKFRIKVPTYGTASGSAKSTISSLYNNTSSSTVTQGDTQITASGVTTMVENTIVGILTTDGSQTYSVQTNTGLTPATLNITGTANYTLVEFEKIG